MNKILVRKWEYDYQDVTGLKVRYVDKTDTEYIWEIYRAWTRNAFLSGGRDFSYYILYNMKGAMIETPSKYKRHIYNYMEKLPTMWEPWQDIVIYNIEIIEEWK